VKIENKICCRLKNAGKEKLWKVCRAARGKVLKRGKGGDRTLNEEKYKGKKLIEKAD
jgi:hypothetical protein